MTEDWLLGLKAAYEAGYYKTEASIGEQTNFPWQGRTCKDCPFWLNGVCRVYAEKRGGEADTCPYFEPANHLAAKHIVESRQREIWKKIWEWRKRQQ